MIRYVTHLAVKPEPGGDDERLFYALSYAPSEKRYSELRNEDVANPIGARFSLPLPIVGDDGETVIGSVTEFHTSLAGFRVKGRIRSAVETKADVWEHAELWAQVQGEKAALGLIFVPDEGKDVPLPGGGRRYDSFEVKAFTLTPVANNRDARLVVGKTIAYPLPAREKPQRPTVRLMKAAEKPLPDYVPCDNEPEDWRRVLASLPADIRKNADELRSHVLRTGDGKRYWEIRDKFGGDLARIPRVAPDSAIWSPKQSEAVTKDATPARVAALPRNLERRLAKLEKNALPFPIEKFAEALGGVVGESMRPLLKRIEALEKGASVGDKSLGDRIGALENVTKLMQEQIERTAWRYRGYWSEGMDCRKNDLVTESGNLWIALTDTAERPSYTASSWSIAARKGRDAK